MRLGGGCSGRIVFGLKGAGIPRGGSLNLCNHMLNGPFHRMSMPSSIWAISLSWSISVASFDPSSSTDSTSSKLSSKEGPSGRAPVARKLKFFPIKTGVETGYRKKATNGQYECARVNRRATNFMAGFFQVNFKNLHRKWLFLKSTTRSVTPNFNKKGISQVIVFRDVLFVLFVCLFVFLCFTSPYQCTFALRGHINEVNLFDRQPH